MSQSCYCLEKINKSLKVACFWAFLESTIKKYLIVQKEGSRQVSREVLQDVGKITAEIAKAKAETEFEKYRVVQDRLFVSDFDKYMLELEENAKK